MADMDSVLGLPEVGSIWLHDATRAVGTIVRASEPNIVRIKFDERNWTEYHTPKVFFDLHSPMLRITPRTPEPVIDPVRLEALKLAISADSDTRTLLDLARSFEYYLRTGQKEHD